MPHLECFQSLVRGFPEDVAVRSGLEWPTTRVVCKLSPRGCRTATRPQWWADGCPYGRAPRVANGSETSGRGRHDALRSVGTAVSPYATVIFWLQSATFTEKLEGHSSTGNHATGKARRRKVKRNMITINIFCCIRQQVKLSFHQIPPLWMFTKNQYFKGNIFKDKALNI